MLNEPANLKSGHSSIANQLKDAFDELEALKASPACMNAIALDVTAVDAIPLPCSNCALLELKLNSAIEELQKFDASHMCSHCEDSRIKMKEMTEIVFYSKTASCENCVKLTIENDVLNKILEEKAKIEQSMPMTASKKVIDSNSCDLCIEIEHNVDKIQEAFRVKFKEQLDRIRDDYCVSCEALKAEATHYKEKPDRASKSNKCASCKELAKQNDYLNRTLERFTSGQKNLNMILDRSKVSVNNGGLGFNSLEHSKNHPPKVVRAVESGLFEVKPPKPSKIVFKSAGFAQTPSSKIGASTSSGQTPQKVKYHCTFYKKDGHIVELCFCRAKIERKKRMSALRTIR